MVRKRKPARQAFVLRDSTDFFPAHLLPEEEIPRILLELEDVRIGRKEIWVREFRLQINIKLELQWARCHPLFIQRILQDNPDLSQKNNSRITCGEDEDFAEKLREGDVTLAHTIEEVIARRYDVVLQSFSGLDQWASWGTLPKNRPARNNLIRMFYVADEPFPAELFGLEEMIIRGYMNEIFKNPFSRKFDINQRTQDFIEHRTEYPQPSDSKRSFPLKRGISRLSRRLGSLVKVASFFSTS